MKSEKPLENCTIGISISESEDLALLGFDRLDINRTVVRLSELLLASGARIAFGHDWRPGGVMEAVATLAIRYRYLDFPKRRAGLLKRRCPVINRVAFPDVPYLQQNRVSVGSDGSSHSLAKLLEGVVDAKQSKSAKDCSRAESLTLLRKELSRICDIRICLGGKSEGFQGGMPGVLEEAVESIKSGKLVIVSSIFGGVSRMIVDVISGNQANAILDAPVLSSEKRLLENWTKKRFVALTEEEDRRLLYSVSPENCAELILKYSIKYWESRNI